MTDSLYQCKVDYAKKISSYKKGKEITTMANEEIRNLIKKYRLFQYEIAEQMGISEGYLSTMLRKPLTKEMEENIKDAINKIINQ